MMLAPQGISDPSTRSGIVARDAELERLRDRVEQLEVALGLNQAPALMAAGLSPTSARLLAMLLKREFLSWEGARLALAPDSYSNNYASVYVCKLRKFLGPKVGALIQTRWGTGIYIATKDKAAIRAFIEQGGA